MSRYLSLPVLVALLSPLNASPPKAPCEAQTGAPGGGSWTWVEAAKPAKSVAKKAGVCGPCAGLIEIMETTRDPDTFLMAVAALPSVGEKGCRALPAVVRNAERLGLLKGMAKGQWTPAQQVLLNSVQQLRAAEMSPTPYGYLAGTPYPYAPQPVSPPPLADVPPAVAYPPMYSEESIARPERIGPANPPAAKPRCQFDRSGT